MDLSLTYGITDRLFGTFTLPMVYHGGLGFTFDFQGYRMLSDSLMLNGTLYYLANPRETNGESAKNGGTEFSVPDQYAARVGVPILLLFRVCIFMPYFFSSINTFLFFGVWVAGSRFSFLRL